MCRLLGYVSDRDYSLAEIAGPHFDEFAALSSRHCDGWGVAELELWADSPALVVEPARASASENFQKIT